MFRIIKKIDIKKGLFVNSSTNRIISYILPYILGNKICKKHGFLLKIRKFVLKKVEKPR